ncbi:MAG: hypothetical protein OXF56_24665 [Rhodobacteraceae bacterium]|nr:hypothetical protein [Paracoccaceae bacterium]
MRRQSMLTGRMHEMELPVDPELLRAWLVTPFRSRPFVQNAFSDLTEDQWEFILTGATPEETAEFW